MFKNNFDFYWYVNRTEDCAQRSACRTFGEEDKITEEIFPYCDRGREREREREREISIYIYIDLVDQVKRRIEEI